MSFPLDATGRPNQPCMGYTSGLVAHASTDGDGVLDSVGVYIAFNLGSRFIGNSDDRQSLLAVLLVKTVQVRDFASARSSPRGPLFDQDHLACE